MIPQPAAHQHLRLQDFHSVFVLVCDTKETISTTHSSTLPKYRSRLAQGTRWDAIIAVLCLLHVFPTTRPEFPGRAQAKIWVFFSVALTAGIRRMRPPNGSWEFWALGLKIPEGKSWLGGTWKSPILARKNVCQTVLETGLGEIWAENPPYLTGFSTLSASWRKLPLRDSQRLPLRLANPHKTFRKVLLEALGRSGAGLVLSSALHLRFP